jgi:hypothetical protein
MSQMTAALKQAIQQCLTPKGHNPFGTVIEEADCFTSRERPVWFSYDPDTVDLYDIYAEKRSEAAKSFDKKLITQQGLNDELSAATRDFSEQVHLWRQAIVNYDGSQNARISDAASDIGQIFGAVLIGAAEVAGAAATQAQTQPTGIVSTSTTCQTLISTVQCNSLSW